MSGLRIIAILPRIMALGRLTLSQKPLLVPLPVGMRDHPASGLLDEALVDRNRDMTSIGPLADLRHFEIVTQSLTKPLSEAGLVHLRGAGYPVF